MKSFIMRVTLFIALLFILFLSPVYGAAEKRGVKVTPKNTSQSAEHRIALVIGNASYRVGSLRNPVNDARAVSSALRELGFEVDEKTNLSFQEMGRAVNRFGQGIRRDSVALFYYAGHGIQVQGSNYLVPVDAEIQEEGDVQFNAVNAGLVLAKMEDAKNPMNIVILDACRDNPFARSWKRSSGSRGLAKMDAPMGSIIAYAASQGKTADDGPGKNGLYTESLILQIKAPGLKIEEVFKRVRAEVQRKSGGRQVPEETTQLVGDFYFARGSMVVEETPASSAVREPAMGRLTVQSNVGDAKTKSIVMEKLAPPPVVENKTGDISRDPTTGMELVFVKGGCYEMGDTFGDGQGDEKPVHNVCVNDFYMGKYEVTIGQFKRFVNETGYKTDGEKNTVGNKGCWAFDQDDKEKKWNWRDWASWKKPNKYQDNSDDHPVSCVTWNDTKAFTDWLTRKSGKNYRLPTEAEWEYAARGGNAKRNYWGDGKDDACGYANVTDRSKLPAGNSWSVKHDCTDGYTFVAPVGKFQSNAFGLYDMMGNVWEWCQDSYGENYYSESSKDNPRGPSSGKYRMARGGSWSNSPAQVRAAFRRWFQPTLRFTDTGFRLSASSP